MTAANKLSPSEIPARVAGICSSSSRVQGKKGFTLIELLVGGAMVVMVCGAISTMFSGCDTRSWHDNFTINPMSPSRYAVDIDKRQEMTAREVVVLKGENAALRARVDKLEADFRAWREMNPLPAEASQRRNIPAPAPVPR